MTTPMLQIIATLSAKKGAEDRLRGLLVPAVDTFRQEPGCEGYILMEDRKQAGRFVTYETWTDEAALAQHMKSPMMQALGPTMQALLEGEIAQEFLSVIVAR